MREAMNKTILSLSLALILVGCGGGSDSKSSEPQPEKDPTVITENIEVSDYKLTQQITIVDGGSITLSLK